MSPLWLEGSWGEVEVAIGLIVGEGQVLVDPPQHVHVEVVVVGYEVCDCQRDSSKEAGKANDAGFAVKPLEDRFHHGTVSQHFVVVEVIDVILDVW